MFFCVPAFLSPYPYRLKEGAPLAMYPLSTFPLVMYPSDHFFLKALFFTRGSAGFGGPQGFQARGCVAKAVFSWRAFFAMDFSRAGAVC